MNIASVKCLLKMKKPQKTQIRKKKKGKEEVSTHLMEDKDKNKIKSDVELKGIFM
jgi:hypothetical protein